MVDATGIAKLTNLKLGQHIVTARKTGYREQRQLVDLKPGENEPLSVALELLKGTLSVSPGVADAEINLKSIDANQGVGSYTGSINQVAFPPGEYEITVSKKGYKTATRRLTIKPAESVYLEPQLEPLPVERPRAEAMSGFGEVDGKYLIVHLRGASRDTSRSSGTIAVSANKATPQVVYVTGNLPGSPCRFDLVRIDNISESSLIETPDASNNWSRIVIRVRPKDSKKTAHFAINWRLL
ncbi:MAG TPA: PEGA domain-containing protein [Pyrinomonadaceae bacterium]|nr:PEGA domain-containing protein [Pyrinomonadaceae bacterium]